MSRWLKGRTRKSGTRTSPRANATFLRLGRRLRELRKNARLTQEQAAEQAGLDWKTLQDFERGETNPTVASLVAIADAYGISLSELFEGV